MKQTTVEKVLTEIGKIVRQGVVNVLITNEDENAPLLILNANTITPAQLEMLPCLANRLAHSAKVADAP